MSKRLPLFTAATANYPPKITSQIRYNLTTLLVAAMSIGISDKLKVEIAAQIDLITESSDGENIVEAFLSDTITYYLLKK